MLYFFHPSHFLIESQFNVIFRRYFKWNVVPLASQLEHIILLRYVGVCVRAASLAWIII